MARPEESLDEEHTLDVVWSNENRAINIAVIATVDPPFFLRMPGSSVNTRREHDIVGPIQVVGEGEVVRVEAHLSAARFAVAVRCSGAPGARKFFAVGFKIIVLCRENLAVQPVSTADLSPGWIWVRA